MKCASRPEGLLVMTLTTALKLQDNPDNPDIKTNV